MSTINQVDRKAYRILTDATKKIWSQINFLTNAKSVDCEDGQTVESKIGAMKGITTSATVTQPGYAADATLIKTLNDSKLSRTGGTITGNLTVNGTITGASVYNAVWNADYAEAFEYIGDQPEVGDIIEIADNRKIKKADANSKKMIGVCSDSYCILAGSPTVDIFNGKKIAVGIVGQLPIKVIGKVAAGDYITCTGNGIGIVDNNAAPHTIIGQAMESNDNKDVKPVYSIIHIM